MKALVIYKSTYQKNTKKIAEAIAGELGAEVKEPHEVDPASLEDYDLLGFGSGIYYWKHHQEILEFVDSMPCKKKKTFIYSTRGGGSKSLAHRVLKKKMEKKGCEVLGEFSCRAYDKMGPLGLMGGINKGRPNQEDLEAARDFARKILEEL